MLMRYDAALFDADDTLFDFIAAERAAIRKLLREVGIADVDGADAYHAINEACWKDFEKNRIDQKTLKTRRFRELSERFHVPFDAHWAAKYYESALAEESILLPGAEETVRRVAEKLPVVIVTNGIAFVQRLRMARSPILPYIAALIISEEVGAAKPDPKIVFAALNAAGGCAPERALLVGDSLSSDMTAAMRANVDGCWYNPKGLKRPESIRIAYEIADIRQAADIALRES